MQLFVDLQNKSYNMFVMLDVNITLLNETQSGLAGPKEDPMTPHSPGRTLETGIPTSALRQEHELLVTRLERTLGPLSAEHKAFLAIVLRHGGTFEQVARLRGEHASTVSRRFHRLLSRLTDRGRVPRCRPMALSPLEKAVLAEYYLCGRPQTVIAEKFSISRYRVRKTLDRIRRRTVDASGHATARSASAGIASPCGKDYPAAAATADGRPNGGAA
jgi:DNA-directed RNA polymerase specialized sigma24 family protein